MSWKACAARPGSKARRDERRPDPRAAPDAGALVVEQSPQLALALGSWPSLDEADFVVTPSNRAARAWIDRYPDWPAPLVALHGPAGSGKSHLLHLWRQRTAATLIDPAALTPETLPALIGAAHAAAIDFGAADLAVPGAFDERALLHLYNMMGERRGHVLVAARLAPSRWAVALPDLRSRLGASSGAAIDAPDDLLLLAVLGKLFADRQLRPPPEVVPFLAARIERSLDAAARVVDRLDRMAMDSRRSISVALARELLDRTEEP